MDRQYRLNQIRVATQGTSESAVAGDGFIENRCCKSSNSSEVIFLLEEIAALEAINATLVKHNRELLAEMEDVRERSRGDCQ